MSAQPLQSLKPRITPLSCALPCGAMDFSGFHGSEGPSLIAPERAARSPPPNPLRGSGS